MTVLAQDPIVVNRAGPIVDQIPVPADRVQLGPRNHRFHVVDIRVNTDGRGSGWDPHMIVLGYGATRLLPRDLTTPVTSTGDTYLRIDNRFNPFRATTRRGLLEWQAWTDPCRVILSDARARCPRRGSAR